MKRHIAVLAAVSLGTLPVHAQQVTAVQNRDPKPDTVQPAEPPAAQHPASPDAAAAGEEARKGKPAGEQSGTGSVSHEKPVAAPQGTDG